MQQLSVTMLEKGTEEQPEHLVLGPDGIPLVPQPSTFADDPLVFLSTQG
jgi:hypothetical protein